MQNYSIADIESFVSRFYADPNTGAVPRLNIAPYTYNITFSALAQNAIQNAILQIQANADFMCLGISSRAQIGAAQNVGTITAPFVRALISDTGSNEQWMNQAIDLVNLSSLQSYLKLFPYPRIVSGRSSLSITLTNYAPTAETYTTIDLAFMGVRVQSYGG